MSQSKSITDTYFKAWDVNTDLPRFRSTVQTCTTLEQCDMTECSVNKYDFVAQSLAGLVH